jgi:hypothetical protein
MRSVQQLTLTRENGARLQIQLEQVHEMVSKLLASSKPVARSIPKLQRRHKQSTQQEDTAGETDDNRERSMKAEGKVKKGNTLWSSSMVTSHHGVVRHENPLRDTASVAGLAPSTICANRRDSMWTEASPDECDSCRPLSEFADVLKNLQQYSLGKSEEDKSVSLATNNAALRLDSLGMPETPIQAMQPHDRSSTGSTEAQIADEGYATDSETATLSGRSFQVQNFEAKSRQKPVSAMLSHKEGPLQANEAAVEQAIDRLLSKFSMHDVPLFHPHEVQIHSLHLRRPVLTRENLLRSSEAIIGDSSNHAPSGPTGESSTVADLSNLAKSQHSQSVEQSISRLTQQGSRAFVHSRSTSRASSSPQVQTPLTLALLEQFCILRDGASVE